MGGSSNDAGHMSMGGMLNKGVIGDMLSSPPKCTPLGKRTTVHAVHAHVQSFSCFLSMSC
jgi:hypothetical protein